jgi:hypothetical protein
MSIRANRNLGLHERYCVSRGRVGHPPLIVFAAILPDILAPRDLLSLKTLEDALNSAVSRLSKMQPMLGCGVNLDVHPPCWKPNPGITSQMICDVLPFQPNVEPCTRASITEQLLLDGLVHGETFDFATGPLWKVQLATHAIRSSSGDNDRKTSVTLIVHHILTDGVGARNLFAALLTEFTAELRSQSTAAVITGSKTQPANVMARAWTSMPFPPANEDTADIRPSYTRLLTAIWSDVSPLLSKLIPPSVPLLSLLRPTVYTIWPNPPERSPHLAAPRIASIHVPAAIIQGVKDVARQKGVKTLHPVMQAVTLVALQVLFLSRKSGTDKTNHSTQVKVSTPASMRDAKLGHPRACGNYVAGFNHVYPVSSLQSDVPSHGSSSSLAGASPSYANAKAKFWDVALDFAEDVSDPSQKQHAAQVFGMLAYISDTPPTLTSNGTVEGGWEKLLREMMESPEPFENSVELSNLGLFSTDEDCHVEGKEGFEMAWAQSPSPAAESLCLNVSTCYHRNCPSLTENITVPIAHLGERRST